MRRLFLAALLLAAAAPAATQAAWHSVSQTTVGPPPPTFTGDGDIVSGAAWWSSCTIAYSAAVAATGTTAACRAARASDSHQCDVLIATTGYLGNTSNCSTGGDNGQSLASFLSATTGTWVKLYDQTGNGVTWTAGSTPGTITANCGGTTQWCITGNGSTTYTATIPNTEEQSISIVAMRISGTSTQYAYYTSTPIYWLLWQGANTVEMDAGGGNISFTAADAALHSMQLVYNGASSFAYSDGVATVGTQTTGSLGGTTGGMFGFGSSGFIGSIMSMGAWGTAATPVAFTGSTSSNALQTGNLCHNQYVNLGLPNAC